MNQTYKGNGCYYCHVIATLVANNKAMVCSTCNEVKGALSLQEFDIHAYLAYKDGRYTQEQINNISAEVKKLVVLRRKLSSKKAQRARDANNSGWKEIYAQYCIKATGNKPTKYPNPVKTNDLQNIIIDVIKWSGGYGNRIGNEGRVRFNKETGKSYRLNGLNNGIADVHAGHPKLGAIKIEVKNKHTNDKWKEYDAEGNKSAQAEYRDKVLAAGETHYIATDVDSFLAWWGDKIERI